MPRLRDDVLAKQIGVRIAAARRNRQLSQTAAGALLGFTFQQMQKYEQGKNLPSIVVLFKMSVVLHTTVTALIGIMPDGKLCPPTALENVMSDLDGAVIVMTVARLLTEKKDKPLKLIRQTVEVLAKDAD